jgi:hypothetical protein
MARYNLDDRFMPGGSFEPRLNPKIVDRQLNAKLGPPMPQPVVRSTTGGSTVSFGSNASRRRSAGLPDRFTRD